MNEHKDQLDRIERALIGDKDLGIKGVVPRLELVEERQRIIGNKFIYISAVIATLSTTWALIKDKITS